MAGQNYYNIPPPPPPPPEMNHNQSRNNPIPDHRHPQFARDPMPNSRLNMPPSMPYPNMPNRSNSYPPSMTPMTYPRSNLDRPSSSSNFHPEYPNPNPFTYHPSNRIPPNNYYSSSYSSEAGPSHPPPQRPHDFAESHRVDLKRKNPELPFAHTYASPVDARNWSYPVDESQRNVRTRHMHALPLDANNHARNYVPSNLGAQPFYSHANGSRGPEQNNFSPYLPPPQARNATDHGRHNYDLNHGHHGRNHIVPAMRLEPSYQNRNPTVPVPTHQGTMSRYENNSFPPRVDYHRTHPSYVASSANARWRQFGTEFDASSSRSRPVTFSDATGNNGRMRNSNSGFRSSFRHVDRPAPNRWFFDHFESGEGPLIFGSPNLFDQHRDMRLDIDNMSYEELLALEERIGYVNVGLQDERISKCLKEYTHDDQDDEASCVICLELYEEGEEVGRLKCAHDFHTVCIKKWLQMKNTCPVCKSAALEDTC